MILAMGSVASTAKAAVDALSGEGLSVGLARIRVFRPFPAESLRRICRNSRAVVVLERDVSFGKGILATEAKSALFGGKNRPKFFEFFAGMGGEAVSHKDVVSAVKKLLPTIGSYEQKDVEWLAGGST